MTANGDTPDEKQPLIDAETDEETEEKVEQQQDSGSESEDGEQVTVARPATKEPGRDAPRRRQSPPPPPKSGLKRIILLFLLGFFVSLAYAVYKHVQRRSSKPQVIYASRYSKEFKYRPAASPIITETLKDGRIRLRGAIPPTAMPSATSPPLPKTKKRRTRRRKVTKGTKKK